MVQRLEAVASRLEKVALAGEGSSAGTSAGEGEGSSSSSPAVMAWRSFQDENVAVFLKACSALGGDVEAVVSLLLSWVLRLASISSIWRNRATSRRKASTLSA